MELKDVLHFFLPVAVELNNGGSKVYNRTAVAVGNTDDEYRYVTLRMGKGAKSFTHPVLLSEERVKPILRPLSSLTKAEMEECGNLVYDFSDDPELNTWRWQDFETAHAHEQTIWLLQRGFDLFNLIPEGKAIDATSLTQQQ